MARVLGFIGVVSLLAACGIPRDAHDTLARVERSKRIRVGLSESQPWVVRNADEPAGIEANLIRQLAHDLGATTEWHWGGEQAHMEALERFQLDLVIGGLTSKTPWKKTVGMTDTYYGRHVIAAPPGENGWIKRVDEFLSGQRNKIEQVAKGADAP